MFYIEKQLQKCICIAKDFLSANQTLYTELNYCINHSVLTIDPNQIVSEFEAVFSLYNEFEDILKITTYNNENCIKDIEELIYQYITINNNTIHTIHEAFQKALNQFYLSGSSGNQPDASDLFLCIRAYCEINPTIVESTQQIVDAFEALSVVYYETYLIEKNREEEKNNTLLESIQ